jgi:hypothetical protein
MAFRYPRKAKGLLLKKAMVINPISIFLFSDTAKFGGFIISFYSLAKTS